MYITKLVLEKYKRLMMSNIQRFEYNPSKEMQLIIGSNGSGKSSVLEELTPLPAHHSGFLKGGRKTFECEHRTHHYVLTSHYNGGSGEHSFKRNGDELNKGGTFTVQKELVEQEFGLTREIHEMLIGLTPFSELSTAKRREWLTRLSPVNLDYVFDTYNKVKGMHRDQQGVIKHLTKRMARENQDLPDDSERELHNKAINRLTDKLNVLFEERQGDVQSPFQNQDEVRQRLSQAIQRGKTLLSQTPAIPDQLQVTALADLTAAVEKARLQHQFQRQAVDDLVDEYNQLMQSAPPKDETLTDDQIQALRNQLAQHRTALSGITVEQQDTCFPLVGLPTDRNPRELLDQTFTEWLSLLHNFPANDEERFSQDKGREAKEQLQQLKGQKQNLENEQSRLAQRLARLKGCEAVQCPQCTHQFTPGVDPREVVDIDQRLGDIHERLQALDSGIETTTEYLEQFMDYLGFVRAFKRLMESSDAAFRPLWDYCLEHRVMFRQPKRYLSDATQWRLLMDASVQQMELKQQCELLEHKLRFVEAIDKDAVSRADQRRLQLEVAIATQTEALKTSEQEIRRLQQLQQQFHRYTGELQTTIDLTEGLLRQVDQQTEFLYQKAIRDETQHSQIELAQHQEVLSRIDLRDGLLADIQQQHEEAQASYRDFGILAKSLAPTDGLIGRYLMGFMQNVVKLINAVIEEIWTYPMEVLPSKVESDELDYKFPLSVNDGAVIAPDISRGSSSQVDVVNFAFKLLVMKFLRLEEMPLYLDEFGKTFDEQHRLNLIPFINRMMELGQVQQVFYVSHFDATHGAFNQAEVCVLDPTNITVPQVYNKHVVIA